MRSLTTAGGAAVALVALGLALAGCGSDTKTATTSSASPSSEESSSSSAAPSPSAEGQNPTIADYVKQNGITETPVKRGDPGAPTLDLPIPEGWEAAGDKTPEWAYGAIFYSDPAMASDPPTIIAIMSKLAGDVDAAKIFELAPGELKNLPGFEGAGEGGDAKLGGFDAYQVGGLYVRDGVTRLIAQKTVVIPASDGDGVFVLQLNADGTEDQFGPLMDATAVIDEETVITP